MALWALPKFKPDLIHSLSGPHSGKATYPSNYYFFSHSHFFSLVNATIFSPPITSFNSSLRYFKIFVSEEIGIDAVLIFSRGYNTSNLPLCFKKLNTSGNFFPPWQILIFLAIEQYAENATVSSSRFSASNMFGPPRYFPEYCDFSPDVWQPLNTDPSIWAEVRCFVALVTMADHHSNSNDRNASSSL
jgi:hypothetical protein